MPGFLPGFLALLFALTFPACIKRSEIRAAIWLNNGLPTEICAREPELQNYGFYRKLSDGNYEFVAYCNPLSAHWIAIFDEDLEKILGETLPKPVADGMLQEIKSVQSGK